MAPGRRRGGGGVAEAVLWFIRRWLVARATMGVEADIRKDLYARLQILPMSLPRPLAVRPAVVANDERPGAIRRFMSFGLVFLLLNFIQIAVVTAILLAMYWPLGVVVLVSIVPITLIVLHFQQYYTRLSRLAQDQSGMSRPTSRSRRWACGWSSRSAARTTSTTGSTRKLTDLYDTQVSECRCRRSSGRCSRSSRT